MKRKIEQQSQTECMGMPTRFLRKDLQNTDKFFHISIKIKEYDNCNRLTTIKTQNIDRIG